MISEACLPCMAVGALGALIAVGAYVAIRNIFRIGITDTPEDR